jgi:hypothetical protein
MFNPLTPAQMVTAIGRAAREAARSAEPLDEFDRGQLKSAYSASRHLAIEIESFSEELARQCHAIALAADEAADSLDGDPDTETLRRLAERVRGAGGAPAAGAATADLLELCRQRHQARWVRLRGDVHRALRALCDREVALLAEGIEAGRR